MSDTSPKSLPAEPEGLPLAAALRRNRAIQIRGARQHNLRNLDLDISTGELVVFTGVSGSGKSSLVFDTLYAEGQRRYVETFSAYARQFLDRMDKPQVDRIEGVPPAIAIDQTNPVRTSRSTVGTMTELNDHLKLLFARAATLYCRQCAQPVRRDTLASVHDEVLRRAETAGDPRLVITFPVTVPANFGEDEVLALLQAQGYTRVHASGDVVVDGTAQRRLHVVQDRLRAGTADDGRLAEAIEHAMQRGRGRMSVHVLDDEAAEHECWRFSTGLHCAPCDIAYSDPLPSLFSFNSPIGACETCRGFGRVIGIDLGLVIPDESLTLDEGAVRPWQTESFKECQRDLRRFAAAAGVPLDVPWRDMDPQHRRWVVEGGDDWTGKWNTQWYGVRHFFDWLESKAYKMHIRVLLSKYRSYTPCTVCGGARLKPDALLWRIGGAPDSPEMIAAGSDRFMPAGVQWSQETLAAMPGLHVHDLMLRPIERVARFFDALTVPAPLDAATDLLLTEIRARLRYLREVGLSYLSLDRQSRTLSGGEVQRINLTTALGTSLVQTLFVLDEPSIGLHPRDMGRIVEVMQRLRDAGNSLVVVEHDPQLMFAADRIFDIGPGAGERGGRIVFEGTPTALAASDTLTGQYLSGRRRVDVTHPQPVSPNTPKLLLEGARANNLKNVSVEIPLGRLVCLTGVSGSGKSTLMQNVLLPALLKAHGRPAEAAGEHDRLLGEDWIDGVVHVDQSPIGKTARSNPVSYVGAFDAIRRRFAAAPLARERGYTPGTFSFNAGDGRCPTCSGNGFEHVEMQFLSDVYLRCPDCDGKRFRPEVLEVTIDSPDGMARSIDQVLELTVQEALDAFGSGEIRTRLQPLADVGLEYLRLGQPVPTLSGGEAQRLKLAGFLAEAESRREGARRRKSSAAAAKPGAGEPSGAGKTSGSGKRHGAHGGTLYLFDEPTTGLHFDDVARLLRALRKLLAAGHSLLIIEHNLDLIRAADWLIEMGPEGGEEGGEVVATGSPSELAERADTHTGRALADYERATAHVAGSASGAAHPASGADLDDAVIPTGEGERGQHRYPLSVSQELIAAEPVNRPRELARDAIFVHHAREHNLKNVDVLVPRNQLTVITGVSGSGKSTLAFDVIFGEGQRRYLESLNAYARQFVQPASRPDVDGVYGIPPTVAIEQRTSRGGRKSTVATLTEIYHFLRLLYVKLGLQYCPTCNVAIESQDFDAIAARILRDYRGRHIGLLAPLVVARKGVYTDLAKWASGKGHPFLRVDGRFLPTATFPRLDRYIEHDIELPVADLVVQPDREAELRDALRAALEAGHGVVMVAAPLEALADASRAADGDGFERAAAQLSTHLFSTRRACPSCGTSFPEPDPRLFSFNSKIGWCTHCFGTGVELPSTPQVDERRNGTDIDVSSGAIGVVAEQMADQAAAQMQAQATEAGLPGTVLPQPCSACDGRRLNPVALAVRLGDLAIDRLTAQSVDDCTHWFEHLELDARGQEIARDVVTEIRARLAFLREVGLGYLTLDRSAPTLSGGEAQRIRLAAQLGSNLQGVCYVLDEPTIGLHPRDNEVLLGTLKNLRDQGNTLLVVEHDEETIRQADHVIDIGPGAGRLGGRIVATGTPKQLAGKAESLTGQMLRRPPPPLQEPRRTLPEPSQWLRLRGAHLHNLKSVDAAMPLGRMTVVTGVSGSGKSTLARDVLFANVAALVSAQNRRAAEPAVAGVQAIEGWQSIGRVLEVDQTPIGKTPRSCPATYIGFWDHVRRLFADTAEARLRGWGPGRFSFNAGAGRCPVCDGQGQRTIEMSFLPDVKVPCDACNGRRFSRETEEVLLHGRSVGDVLAMEVDEALPFFGAHPRVSAPLQLLKDVGLGYLTLGQPSPTLSGGEAQRIKLVTELARARPGGPHTLYVLDEPTVGLHMSDVERLLQVLHRLVEAGNTLVVVEHDLDLWAHADWILDLGPGGGAAGGQVVAADTPQALAARAHTATSQALARFLRGHATAVADPA